MADIKTPTMSTYDVPETKVGKESETDNTIDTKQIFT